MGTVGRVPGRIGRGLVLVLCSCCAVDGGGCHFVDFGIDELVRLRRLFLLDLVMMALFCLVEVQLN